MTIEEALLYLNEYPAWSPQAVAEGTMVMGLSSVTDLLNRLGNPQNRVPCVHIAGTNGKGSTAAFIQSILMESGLKVGLFTSPYLYRFSEEIRIGKDPISDDALTDIVTRVRTAVVAMKAETGISPTRFEVECTTAFLYFAEQHCDLAVLEVGLGGRSDATNVIPTPALAVITTISLDHTEILGSDPVTIASEKAGIIKPGGDVLVNPQPEDIYRVFADTCREQGANLIDANVPDHAVSWSLESQTFDLSFPEYGIDLPGLSIGLLGKYQIKNAALAVHGSLILKKKGFPVTEKAIRDGLAHAVWPGRFELMRRNPTVFCDGSHNEEGVRLLAESLKQYFGGRKIRFVTGVLADKAYDKMMADVLPMAEAFYTVTPPSPRALPAADLANWLNEHGADAKAFDQIETAISCAVSDAGEDGIVCIFGSLYYIGIARCAVK